MSLATNNVLVDTPSLLSNGIEIICMHPVVEMIWDW